MAGGQVLVVDSNELRGLASAARSQGARIKADEGRAARIIASVDRTGWDAGAALGKWSGVKSGLDNLQADQTRAALDLERRATLVDIANSPDFSIFGGPISLGPLFHPFDLADLPNAPAEWQHLLNDLPPGWSDLTRRQRLALIDVVPFGALGYQPYAAPPPPPKPEHHSWFHNLVHGVEDDLGDAGKWTLRQGEDFGNTFWSAGKGAVNYADDWVKAILRTGINSTYELQHGGLTDPLHAPPPPLQGPEIQDMVNRLPSDMFHGLIQPGVDLYHGRVGAAAADLILLVGFKGLKMPRWIGRAGEDAPIKEPPPPPAEQPSTPVGHKGSPIDVKPGTNAPEVINGRSYTGHALDQMQGRGIPPSVVDHAIEKGSTAPSRGGTTVHYDPANNVSVVTNAQGAVVTVSYGDFR